MATYYAWSNIRVHDGKKVSVVLPGTEVSADSLHCDEEGFKELIESGAVRSKRWPKDLDPKNPNAPSPNQHMLAKLREQRESVEGGMYDTGGENPDDAAGNNQQQSKGN